MYKDDKKNNRRGRKEGKDRKGKSSEENKQQWRKDIKGSIQLSCLLV